MWLKFIWTGLWDLSGYLDRTLTVWLTCLVITAMWSMHLNSTESLTGFNSGEQKLGRYLTDKLWMYVSNMSATKCIDAEFLIALFPVSGKLYCFSFFAVLPLFSVVTGSNVGFKLGTSAQRCYMSARCPQSYRHWQLFIEFGHLFIQQQHFGSPNRLNFENWFQSASFWK